MFISITVSVSAAHFMLPKKLKRLKYNLSQGKVLERHICNLIMAIFNLIMYHLLRNGFTSDNLWRFLEDRFTVTVLEMIGLSFCTVIIIYFS